MAQNPLQQYFRQPKIFIDLPSRGAYHADGTLLGEVTNMPVYGMTGMDEIIVKTPDALMTGESVVKVIESCCPTVKDAWSLSVLDTDLIFAAIRIATYGNQLGMSNTCTECGAESDYDADLNKVVEHYSNCKYDNRVVVGDLVINLHPLTYKQSTEFNMKNFAFQQQLRQVEPMEETPERQAIINKLWNDLAESQNLLFTTTIHSVETESTIVTERGHIEEWIKNCDRSIIDAVKEQIEKNRRVWDMPTYPVKCNSCGHEVNLMVDLDQSNFFV